MAKLIKVSGVKLSAQKQKKSHKKFPVIAENSKNVKCLVRRNDTVEVKYNHLSEHRKRVLKKGIIKTGGYKIPNAVYNCPFNYDCVRVMSRV